MEKIILFGFYYFRRCFMKISQVSNICFNRKVIGEQVSSKNTFENSLNTTNLKNMPIYYVPSFGAKTNAQKLEYIGEDNFPNPSILETYKTAIQNGDDVLLCDIHKDFYSGLLDCTTLDEAKQLYPEFIDVIDASKLPEKEYNGTLKRIAKGELEGASLEDLSLELLKKHYGQSLGYAKKESYWGIDPKSNQNLFAKLNINTLNREYFITISRETPERRAICSQNTKKLWQDSEYREGRSEDAKKRWQRSDYREKTVASIKQLWEDPAKREAQAEAMRKMHAQEGFEEKRIAGIKKGWADPERRVELTELIRQSSAIRWADPEQRAKMSAFMLEKWQDPEYREKICSGISERMIERWKDPAYIEFKTNEKTAQWLDPEFREYMSETMKAKWQDPEYRKRMAIYSEALKLAWEMHPEITQKMSEIATEFPSLGKVLAKSHSGVELNDGEDALLKGYYKKCHQEMPNFTWIVGQTQKEILELWAQQEKENK